MAATLTTRPTMASPLVDERSSLLPRTDGKNTGYTSRGFFLMGISALAAVAAVSSGVVPAPTDVLGIS